MQFTVPDARGFENQYSVYDRRTLNLNPGEKQMPGPLGQIAIINEPKAQWIQGRMPFQADTILDTVLGSGPDVPLNTWHQQQQSKLYNSLRYGTKFDLFRKLHQPIHSGNPTTTEIPYYKNY